ncbi:hypothetical protein PAMP_024485 [Pampus punctatissimus]
MMGSSPLPFSLSHCLGDPYTSGSAGNDGTSAATPWVFCLSSGSRSSSSCSSIGGTPVTETNLPRDSGSHQGGVSVPADSVPQCCATHLIQILSQDLDEVVKLFETGM